MTNQLDLSDVDLRRSDLVAKRVPADKVVIKRRAGSQIKLRNSTPVTPRKLNDSIPQPTPQAAPSLEQHT